MLGVLAAEVMGMLLAVKLLVTGHHRLARVAVGTAHVVVVIQAATMTMMMSMAYTVVPVAVLVAVFAMSVAIVLTKVSFSMLHSLDLLPSLGDHKSGRGFALATALVPVLGLHVLVLALGLFGMSRALPMMAQQGTCTAQWQVTIRVFLLQAVSACFWHKGG